MGRAFAHGRKHFLLGDIDFVADTLQWALLADGASIDQTAELFDPSGDGSTGLASSELSGSGYSRKTATTKSVTVTAADSWATTWAAGTAYEVGELVRPTAGNGHLYRCITAGTSHASTEPTWPTSTGQDVSDNTAEWEEAGVAVVVADCDDPEFAAAGGALSYRYAVLLVAGTPGTDDWVIAYEDAGSAQSISDGQTATVRLSATLGAFYDCART